MAQMASELQRKDAKAPSRRGRCVTTTTCAQPFSCDFAPWRLCVRFGSLSNLLLYVPSSGYELRETEKPPPAARFPST